MRTLALHGYGQDAKLAEEKWAKTFKKIGLDVTYLEAPLDVINKNNEPRKGWFTWSPASSLIYTSTEYHNVADTLDYIENFINTNGPYDLILGYSQGGTIASILLTKREIKVKFLVIMSSYESLDPNYQVCINDNIPTLLVYGERDTTVPKQYTINMGKGSENTLLYCHNGTHSIPSHQEFISTVKKFIGR